MAINYEIRKATLETAINVLLMQKGKSISRTARNLIDIGCSLSKNTITENMKNELYNNLITLIINEDTNVIKTFVINTFL